MQAKIQDGSLNQNVLVTRKSNIFLTSLLFTVQYKIRDM